MKENVEETGAAGNWSVREERRDGPTGRNLLGNRGKEGKEGKICMSR